MDFVGQLPISVVRREEILQQMGLADQMLAERPARIHHSGNAVAVSEFSSHLLKSVRKYH